MHIYTVKYLTLICVQSFSNSNAVFGQIFKCLLILCNHLYIPQHVNLDDDLDFWRFSIIIEINAH